MQQAFGGYVSQLAGTKSEDAWHGLVELGPAALPFLHAAFESTAEPAVRSLLLRVIQEHRDEGSIDLLVAALGDGSREVWMTALDVLVAIGGERARAALARFECVAPEERRAWLCEASGQVSAGTQAAERVAPDEGTPSEWTRPRG